MTYTRDNVISVSVVRPNQSKCPAAPAIFCGANTVTSNHVHLLAMLFLTSLGLTTKTHREG